MHRSNVPGIADIIKDQHTGFLSDGLESDHIAEAILKARNFKNIESIREKSIKDIINDYSFESYFLKIKEVINIATK